MRGGKVMALKARRCANCDAIFIADGQVDNDLCHVCINKLDEGYGGIERGRIKLRLGDNEITGMGEWKMSRPSEEELEKIYGHPVQVSETDLDFPRGTISCSVQVEIEPMTITIPQVMFDKIADAIESGRDVKLYREEDE
jgi:hypothetical protein